MRTVFGNRGRWFGSVAATVILAFLCAGIAQADTVSSITNGTATSSGSFYWGERVQTNSGGPWNNLAFNFYAPSTSYPGTPQAVGNLYLLSQQYLGAPDALSASTTGFIAEGSASGNYYDFAPGVTVLGSTTYWVYTDSALTLTGDASGGEYYFTSSASSNFNAVATNSINYTLTGTPTPEPSSLILFGSGLAGLASIIRRKRRA